MLALKKIYIWHVHTEPTKDLDITMNMTVKMKMQKHEKANLKRHLK